VTGFLKGSATIVAILGLGAGVLALLGAQGAYHYSSSDEFCSGACHSMQAYVASDPHFVESLHRNPPSGIQVGCSDCHVPPSFPASLVYKTKSGIRDIYQEMTSDFSDPGTWESRREALARKVRDWYMANDSAPCRACHTPEKLAPKRESGQRQHELAEREGVTCIGCHFNLVHRPVAPSQELIEYGRVSADMTRVAEMP
jgi:nitrate/TMAO reductase-like tetraheme cytochrome c subunit